MISAPAERLVEALLDAGLEASTAGDLLDDANTYALQGTIRKTSHGGSRHRRPRVGE
jgi:hypothetical protein